MSLPEDLCTRFLRPEKNPSTSVGFEPADLGSRAEHVTPRPPIPYCTTSNIIVVLYFNFLFSERILNALHHNIFYSVSEPAWKSGVGGDLCSETGELIFMM